jgi:hypothetical protein
VNARVVLAPELSYVELDATVRRLGWEHVSGPTYPPLVAGEPELATWRQGGDSLSYICNPVAWLRVLDLSAVAEAARRLALVASLPLLEDDELRRLLRSRAPETVLLGVLAVDVLRASKHLPAVRALMHHREPTVAQAAQRVVAVLSATTRAESGP